METPATDASHTMTLAPSTHSTARTATETRLSAGPEKVASMPRSLLLGNETVTIPLRRLLVKCIQQSSATASDVWRSSEANAKIGNQVARDVDDGKRAGVRVLENLALVRGLHVARLRIYDVRKAVIVDAARYRKRNKHHTGRPEERACREHTAHAA